MSFIRNANPNATNSELDAKKIVKHVALTPSQKYDLISQYCELVVDGMDMDSLVQYAHEQMTNYFDNLILSEIKEEIENNGLKVHLHSLNKKKIDNKTDIYLVDTFGETKLFIKICKIVFLGGSLIRHGGQNPLEAARLGRKVIHGPNIDNFLEVYNLLNKNNISSKIRTISQAKGIVQKNLNNKFSSKKIIKKLNFIGNEVLLNNQKEINKYI